ncbi:hypothetical protein ACI65C_006245, partial [Semiaphis heraclei]
FINGIIEFDQKIIPLSTNLLTPQRSWTKRHWNMIFISLFAYFIGIKSIVFYSCLNIVTTIKNELFSPPFIIHFAITISSCFFLQNINARFQTLNDVWKCLPVDLVGVSGQWTHIEIVELMENTRLLHSELCGLLNMFTLGYGPLLLGLFLTSFINMIVTVYLIVNSKALSIIITSAELQYILIPLVIHTQIIIFLMSIIIFVSSINQKKLDMISCLRSNRISNLHLDKKKQIKMFMSQISVCDSDQISAFGFFDINLNLVTS